MIVKKLLSTNVGSHYPEQAVIFTELGELYVTSNNQSAEGFELIPFLDLTMINSRINQLLRGHSLSGVAEVEVHSGSIQVSPIANCFKVVNYSHGTVITEIEGETSGQPITIVGSGDLLTIQANSEIRLAGDMDLVNEFSTLRIQQKQGIWQETSRSNNT